MNSPLMWLRGDYGDRGLQAMNFQGIGVTPWMQPRVDASMLGLQPDMYQAMAAAALQEMRAVDPSKPIPTSLLQFQQTQNLPSRSASLMQPQMLHQSQTQQPFLQGVPENQPQPQPQPQTPPHLLQQQLQHQHSFNNQQLQQQQPQPSQQQQLVDHQQIPSVVSPMSHYSSASQSQSPSLQAISSMCQQPNFSDSNGAAVTSSIVSPLHSILGSFPPPDEASHLLNLPRSNLSSAVWPSKRAAVEPLIASGPTQCALSQVEQLGPPQTNLSPNSVSLPPFPGRECAIDQEGNTDPQSHLLFGVNIEPSSLLMQNGISNLRGVGSESDSTTMQFPSSSYMSTTGTNFSLNPAAITPSSCIDESGFLQSPENAGQGNNPNRTFVKVSCLRIPNYIYCLIFYFYFVLHY